MRAAPDWTDEATRDITGMVNDLGPPPDHADPVRILDWDGIEKLAEADAETPDLPTKEAFVLEVEHKRRQAQGKPSSQDRRDYSRAARVVRSAYDLRRKQFAPIRYILPGYVAEGCTLLAGRPKLGKSWFVLEICLAVSTPGTCLGGIACEHGDVLYLALEDNERRLQRRIDKVLGPLADWPKHLKYATEWPRSNEGGIDAIREWIVSVENPRLVVVDVLAMFKPVRGDRESMYEADYNSLKELQSLAGEFGIAIIVVHHTRKSGSENGDAVEKISGTLGLSGAVDAFLVLDRDGQGAKLEGRGRDVEEVDVAVSFDKETCRWSVLGDAAEVRRSSERDKILDVLANSSVPMGPSEIAVLAGMKAENVRFLLHKLMKTGEIEREGYGKYRRSHSTPSNTAHTANAYRSARDRDDE